MTRSTLIRRIGWTTAVLAACVLATQVHAGNQRNPQKSGQNSCQVEKDNNRQSKRAEPARNPNKQKEAANKQARRDPSSAPASKNANRDRNRQEAAAKQAHQEQKAAEERRAKQEAREKAQRQAEREAAQRKQKKEPKPVVAASVSTQRGANWGVNAQRKKLEERQTKVRRQEQKIVQNRQELREAKDRFDLKVQREKQELRQRDARLDAKAQTLRHISIYKPHPHVVIHDRKPRVPYRSDSHRDHDKNYSNFSIGIRIGDNIRFNYIDWYRWPTYHHGGYYVWQWVPPLVVTRYDACGRPYAVVIREGYYTRVWVPRYPWYPWYPWCPY